MKTLLSHQIVDLIQAVHYRPAISIIMPFEPKMKVKGELTQQLKFVCDRVQREIRENYEDDLAELVLKKLQNIINSINYSTYKKSVAIFVSPVFEKVLYLDIPVEEKVIIDESFEIRDLVLAKKEMQQYLVMALNAKSSKIFLSDATHFAPIKIDIVEHMENFQYDSPQRVANFSDPSEEKEIQLKRFLHYADNGLRNILRAYTLPVLLMGTDKVLGYFRSITRNEKQIVSYIHGNFSDVSGPELSTIIQPYVKDWKKIKMKALLQQMELAAGSGKLAKGIKEVWKQATEHRGKLLLVERDYRVSAEYGADRGEINFLQEPYNKFSYIRDVIDDLIEKVLENGGDVEFVDNGMLMDYGRVALIQYY